MAGLAAAEAYSSRGPAPAADDDDLLSLVQKLSQRLREDQDALTAEKSATLSGPTQRTYGNTSGWGRLNSRDELEEEEDDDTEEDEEDYHDVEEADEKAVETVRQPLQPHHQPQPREQPQLANVQRPAKVGFVSDLEASGSNSHQLLGTQTLFKQLQTAVTELESAAAEGREGFKVPVISPVRRTSSFFGRKKGEKKRLIEKLRMQLELADGDCRSLAERLARLGRSTSVALGMLQDQWAQLQAQIDDRGRELESAYELITRHEEEANAAKVEIARLTSELSAMKAEILDVPSVVPQIFSPISKPEPAMPVTWLDGKGRDPSSSSAAELQALVNKLELELDLAHGRIEALGLQQQMYQDRSNATTQKLEGQLTEAEQQIRVLMDQLTTRSSKYAALKQQAEQLEEALEKVHGQNEAMKSQMMLRDAKTEVQVREAQRLAAEMEQRVKNELFNNMRLREENDKLRGDYEQLLGQLEAVKSQVELEKLEMVGLVDRHDREITEVYGRLDAESEYAGMLTDVRQEQEKELVDLKDALQVAETAREQAEATLHSLAARYKVAAARRLCLFAQAQDKRLKKEAFTILRRGLGR